MQSFVDKYLLFIDKLFFYKRNEANFAHLFYLIELFMNKRKVILCVDDEPMILKSLKIELTQVYGDTYTIELAESGEEALEILEELSLKKSDTLLVISDWLMPNMKGDEFLMKVHKDYPTIGKIMLSGQADPKAIERVRSQAMGAFISKPWNKEGLKQAINDNIKVA